MPFESPAALNTEVTGRPGIASSSSWLMAISFRGCCLGRLSSYGYQRLMVSVEDGACMRCCAGN